MKFLNKVLAFALLLVFANAPSIFSQGTLIFEISDPQNKPLSNLDVSISQENSDFSKSYKTDDQGRVVDSNFPAGTNYKYKVPYGDFQTGAFSLISGNFTWINIDYRVMSASFKNDKGEPTPEKKFTVYKLDEDSTETLIGEKISDENGNVTFTLPEGTYKCVSLNGIQYIDLKDENINVDVELKSEEITHYTKFRFIKGGQPLSILAQSVSVKEITSDGSLKDYGVAEAHSSILGSVEI